MAPRIRIKLSELDPEDKQERDDLVAVKRMEQDEFDAKLANIFGGVVEQVEKS